MKPTTRPLSRAYRRKVVIDRRPVWALVPIELADELAEAMTKAVVEYGRDILKAELPIVVDDKVVGRVEAE